MDIDGINKEVMTRLNCKKPSCLFQRLPDDPAGLRNDREANG